MKNYYELLGVSVDASNEVIKAAYRSLSKKYHPDVCTDIPNSEELMQQINAAYDTLSDSQKRMRYDRELELKKTNDHFEYHQSETAENVKKDDSPSQGGCSCSCLLVIILIIAVAVFIPKFVNIIKNSVITGEEDSTQIEEITVYSDPSIPEYCISDFLTKLKQDEEISDNTFSCELLEKMKACISEMETADLVTDLQMNFILKNMKKYILIFCFRYIRLFMNQKM